MGFVYFVCLDEKYVKIGYSRYPYRRFAEIKAYNPSRLSLIGLMEGTLADEKKLHRLFRQKRVRNEWFLYDEVIDQFIDENCEIPEFWDLQETGWLSVSVNDFRKNLSHSLQEVFQEKKRIVLQKWGQAVAAVIPIEDLQLLEEIEGSPSAGLYALS